MRRGIDNCPTVIGIITPRRSQKAMTKKTSLSSNFRVDVFWSSRLIRRILILVIVLVGDCCSCPCRHVGLHEVGDFVPLSTLVSAPLVSVGSVHQEYGTSCPPRPLPRLGNRPIILDLEWLAVGVDSLSRSDG